MIRGGLSLGAVAAFVAAAALVACGGGGGGGGSTPPGPFITPIPFQTPVPTATPAGDPAFDVSTATPVAIAANGTPAAVALPTAGAFGGTLTLPSSGTAAAATLTMRITNSPPDDPGVPALGVGRSTRSARAPLAQVPHTTIFYIRLIASAVIRLPHSPTFSLTVPPRDIIPGAAYYVAFFDQGPANDWDLAWEGPAAVSGSTLVFSANGLATFTFQPNVHYWFALVAIAPGNATPTPSPTPTPSTTPTATPAATATPVPTATPVATATPVPTATPAATATPVPTATPLPTATPTATPVPTATPTSTPVPTATPLPTPTPTPVAGALNTPAAAVTVTSPVTYDASMSTVDFSAPGQTAGVTVSEPGSTYAGPFSAALTSVVKGTNCANTPNFTLSPASGTGFTAGSGTAGNSGTYCGTATVTFTDPRAGGKSVSITLRLTATGVIIQSKRRR